MIVGIVIVIAAIVVALVKIVPNPSDNGIDTLGRRTMPPRDVRLSLEQRFAPVLKLDSKELLVPITIRTYVSTTTLDMRIGKVLKVFQELPTLASLPSSSECTEHPQAVATHP